MKANNKKKFWIWCTIIVAIATVSHLIWKNKDKLKAKFKIAFNSGKTGKVFVENPVIVKDSTELDVKETGSSYIESPLHGTVIEVPYKLHVNQDVPESSLIRITPEAQPGYVSELFHNQKPDF
jgi:hypothetical protein